MTIEQLARLQDLAQRLCRDGYSEWLLIEIAVMELRERK